MEQTVKTRNGLKVSEQTALFVDALRTYGDAKDKLLEGLTALYGEVSANEMFNGEYGPRLDAVDNLLFEALGLSVRDNVTTTTISETI